MENKKQVVYSYNFNLKWKFTKYFGFIKISNLLKFLIISLLLVSCFSIINDFFKTLDSANNKATLVSNFKLDISALNEIALIIENDRNLDNNYEINSFGSDGILLTLNEIKPSLTTALISIADVNNDKFLSDKELLELRPMRLNSDIFTTKLKNLGFNLKSIDCNLNNYIIITEGKYSGTVLYNGPFKFIDDKNKRYWGIDLSN
ncbi:hypothetical protein CLPUN_48600 [Clostridium puniceum]|uniref:Uncharacterized protein n=1 Tax=Clostridium puniceum TaxID=29367 RepID=A0A1S8T2L8_9CLOT|nr:hypothetical protein [Clostridium puniceum]OOM72030.1 hypothetical protein CLPUN_48600 [Clostridium puniceum]